MSEEAFEFVDINRGQIRVRHIAEQYIYSFTFAKGDDGKPQLSDDPVDIAEVLNAPHGAKSFLEDAWKFAIKESRLRGRL